MSGEKVDLDKILLEEVGIFGKYQICLILSAVLYTAISTWASSEYVFTTSRINSRCLIPECESDSMVFTPAWLLNAIPGTSSDSFESCIRYSSVNRTFDLTCPADLFDQTTTEPCEERVYLNTNTVVYDFDLGCNEWARSLIGSARTLGYLTALPISGFISDRWGRKVALTWGAVNTAWIGLVRYFSINYWMFISLQFIEAMMGAASTTCYYIIMMELIPSKYRVIAGTLTSTGFALGQTTLGLIAWAVSYWKNLILTIYIAQILSISLLLIVNESSRWLMSKGRFDEVEKILTKIAKFNGRKLSEKSLLCLRSQKLQEELDSKENKEPWLPLLVFRCKPVLVRCIVAPIWWITMTLTYYGLSLNSASLSGNSYLNYSMVSAVEIPGFWTALYFVSAVGRRPLIAVAYWICTACMIGYIFLPSDIYWLSLLLFLVGKYSISMVATSLYVYTSELFPTRYRSSLFAFCSMLGRIGSITAPLTPALSETVWTEFPYVLFASFCLLSGILIYITPETLGTKLPDTMEEAADLGRRSKISKL